VIFVEPSERIAPVSSDRPELRRCRQWHLVARFLPTPLSGLRARRIYLLGDDLATELSTPDGSWAAVGHTPQNGAYRTIQGGPRRLWDLLETTHQRWTELGEPSWERFGLTVTPEQQRIWLDTPDGEQHWSLASGSHG